MPFSKSDIIDWLKVLLVLLDEIVVLIIFFVVLHFLHVELPAWLLVVLGIIIVPVVLLIHLKVIPSFHMKQITGREGMIGQQGKVVRPLSPEGMVRIRGEDWKARVEDGPIRTGETVEVTGIKGLVLTVTRPEEIKK